MIWRNHSYFQSSVTYSNFDRSEMEGNRMVFASLLVLVAVVSKTILQVMWYSVVLRRRGLGSQWHNISGRCIPFHMFQSLSRYLIHFFRLINSRFIGIFSGIPCWFRSPWENYIYVHLPLSRAWVSPIGRVVGGLLGVDATVSSTIIS